MVRQTMEANICDKKNNSTPLLLVKQAPPKFQTSKNYRRYKYINSNAFKGILAQIPNELFSFWETCEKILRKSFL